MIDSQWFSLSPTPFVIVFSIVIVAACVVLGWMAIKRSEFKRSIMWLEGLRLLMVALVALAILQPEWLQKFLPEEDPVIAVLWDQSHSMDTEDVLPDQGDGILPDGTKATSRKDSIAELTSDATWETFREKMNVVVEPDHGDGKTCQLACRRTCVGRKLERWAVSDRGRHPVTHERRARVFRRRRQPLFASGHRGGFAGRTNVWRGQQTDTYTVLDLQHDRARCDGRHFAVLN